MTPPHHSPSPALLPSAQRRTRPKRAEASSALVLARTNRQLSAP